MDYLPGDGGALSEGLIYSVNLPFSYVPMYGSNLNPAGEQWRQLSLRFSVPVLTLCCNLMHVPFCGPEVAQGIHTYCLSSYPLLLELQTFTARSCVDMHMLPASCNPYCAGMTLFGRAGNVLMYAVAKALQVFMTDPSYLRLRCGSKRPDLLSAALAES